MAKAQVSGTAGTASPSPDYACPVTTSSLVTDRRGRWPTGKHRHVPNQTRTRTEQTGPRGTIERPDSESRPDQVIACLERANYWFTLPLLAVVACLSVATFLFPTRGPKVPPGPAWVHRVVAFCMLGVTVGFALGAINEARNNPDCNNVEETAPMADSQFS